MRRCADQNAAATFAKVCSRRAMPTLGLCVVATVIIIAIPALAQLRGRTQGTPLVGRRPLKDASGSTTGVIESDILNILNANLQSLPKIEDTSGPDISKWGPLRFAGSSPGLKHKDLVVAFFCTTNDTDIIRASRAWRKGVRAVVVFDQEPGDVYLLEASQWNETVVVWRGNSSDTSATAAAKRQALAPFLAHEALKTGYKWMLTGDATTLWLINNVLALLGPFDSTLPYAVTDNMWWHSQHPDLQAPRCLPCHFSQTQDTSILLNGLLPQKVSRHPPGWGFQPPRGCPCTPQLLCEAEERHIFITPEGGCLNPPFLGDYYSIHVAGGLALSYGLMEKLSKSDMEVCVNQVEYIARRDMLMSVCMWDHGIAATDPGYSLIKPGVQLFDPFQWSVMRGPEDSSVIVSYLKSTSEGQCNPECQERLSYLVSACVKLEGEPTHVAAQIHQISDMFDYWYNASSLLDDSRQVPGQTDRPSTHISRDA